MNIARALSARGVNRCLGLVMAASIIALPVTENARGQGTSEVLPGPIHVERALDTADRLAVDRVLRAAWIDIHETYAGAFAELYDNEIIWLVDRLDVLSTQNQVEHARAYEMFFDRRGRILREIERLDRKLFEGWRALLNESQAQKLDLIKHRRARQRYLDNTLTWMVRREIIDLARAPIFNDDDLLQDEAVLAVMSGYDAAMTQLLKQLHDDVLKFYQRMHEYAVEHVGRDHQDQTAVFAADADRTVKRTRQLNRRAVKQLDAVLPADAGREMHAWFYQRTVNEGYATVAEELAVLERLANSQRLDAAGRAELTQAREQLWIDARRALDQLLDLQAEYNNENNIFAFDSEAWTAYQEKRASHLTDLQRAAELARASASGIVGDDWSRLAQADRENGAGAAAGSRATGGSIRASGLWPAAPITPDAMKVLLAILDFDGAALDVANFAADEYRNHADAAHAVWSATQRAGQPDSVDAADARDLVRREGFTRLAELDRKWFADLHELSDSDQQVVVASARRLRGIHRREHVFEQLASNYPIFDLLVVVEESDLPEAAFTRIGRRLNEYERHADALAVLARDASVQMQLHRERLNAERAQASRQGRPSSGELMGESIQAMSESHEELAGVALEVLRINLDGAAALVSQLDTEEAETFGASFRRHAYPDVFGMEDVAAARLGRAATLPGITTEQLLVIARLSRDHGANAERLANRMVELHDLCRTLDLGGSLDEATRESAGAKLEWLAFLRDESGDRALARLELILSPGHPR